MESLEEEVAVHRCGSAFASSATQCHLHHQQEAASQCQAAHAQGQQACMAAWQQLDNVGQMRDRLALNAAHHTSPVFWPLTTQTSITQETQKMPSYPASYPASYQAPPISTGSEAASLQSASQALAQGTSLSGLLKATQRIQAQVAALGDPVPPVAPAAGTASLEAPEVLIEEPSAPSAAKVPSGSNKHAAKTADDATKTQKSEAAQLGKSGTVQVSLGSKLHYQLHNEVKNTKDMKAEKAKTAKTEAKKAEKAKKAKTEAKKVEKPNTAKTEAKKAAKPNAAKTEAKKAEKAEKAKKPTTKSEAKKAEKAKKSKQPETSHGKWVARTTRDVADSTFNSLDSEKASKHAAAAAKTKNMVRMHQMLSQPAVDPAQNGEAAYRQKHPLSVAMQACHARQRKAAVNCLQTSRRSCHGVWVKAYLACFSVFGQARKWLEKSGRLPPPRQLDTKPKKVAIPASLRRTAQLSCAHAYAGFSQKCKAAHRSVGALCRQYATRSGVMLSAAAAKHCGSMHAQAEAVCSRARASGRAQCDSAWATARAVMVQEHDASDLQQSLQYGTMLSTVGNNVRHAQMASTAQLKIAADRLQDARRRGVTTDSEVEETALLDLDAVNGVGLSLSALSNEAVPNYRQRAEMMLLQDQPVDLYKQQQELYQELLNQHA